MKYFLPIDISITDSNIAVNEGADGTIYPHDYTQTYTAGVLRYKDTRLYEARVKILPLAKYSWNSVEPNDLITTNLLTQTVIDSTTVPIIIDDIVYHTAEGTFYKSKQNRTVDFETEIYTEANWNIEDVGVHRYLYLYPDESPLYWKDVGATNRNKCADKAVNSQSIKNSTEMWFEFTAKNINKVALFNLAAKSTTITVYDTDIESPIYENTKDSLLDTSLIVNWRTLSQYEPYFVQNVAWDIPFISGIVTIRITLENTVASDLLLGEILAGQTEEIGKTTDGVPVSIKSAGKIVEQDNGDIVFEDEGDITKVYDILNFNVLFKSEALDITLDRCRKMINNRIVVFGENTDDEKYKSLIVYGFSRDASPDFKSNSSHSNIKLQVQRFT